MGDIYFSNVSLLLPFDGANGSTSFPDASPAPKTVSRLGNTVISSTQSKFGGTSGYFDGNGDYLELADSEDFNFGSGDFTIEAWVYGTGNIVGQWPGIDATYCSWLFTVTGAYRLQLTYGVSTLNQNLTGANTITPNAWNHVVVTKNNGLVRFFINGVIDPNTFTISGSLNNSSYPIRVGTADLVSYFSGYIDSLRITKGVARYTANFTPPTTAFPTDWEDVPDPYYDNVVLHLPMDGPENGITFIDRSLSPKTITTVGNTSLKIAQSKFGGRSCYFDGSGDYLSIPSTADFGFGTADFTLECWIYVTASYVERGIFDFRDYDGSSTGTFFISNSNKLSFWYGSLLGNTGTAVTANVWHHAAFVRSSGTLSCYLNGNLDWSSTASVDFVGSRPLGIGGSVASTLPPGSSPFYGYIDSLRITKGIARYTSNFTVPTGPFAIGKPYVADPYASGVKLLITGSGVHGRQVITDESPTANTITVVGDTSIDRRYSKVGGGSIYFDGVGDYLELPSNSSWNLANQIFTIEAWIYSGSSALQFICSTVSRAGAGDTVDAGWLFALNSQKLIFGFHRGSGGTYTECISVSSYPLNTWTHVAVVCEGSGVYKLYLNGIQDGSLTNTGLADNSKPLRIGISNDTGYPGPFTGYINNLRITKGVARYTANFTPSYTYLIGPSENLYDKTVLTLQLNGNYVDSSPKNNTVTAYGNASLSTTTYKYGTGSLYLDGVGDYIAVPDTVNFRFGTGDFCIECWVYPTMTSFADINCIFDHKTGDPSGWYLYLNWQGKVELYNSSTYLTGNTALTKNVWTHIAVIRSSGTTTIWVNGIADCTPNTGGINSDFYGSTTYFAIGALVNIRQSQYDFKGYIDNVRITKGAARYTSAFTPADFESQSAVGPVRAYSTQSITSNGAVKFTIPVAGTLQAGFSVNAPTDATKTDLEYSIQISTSKVLTIVESGVVKSTVGTASDGSNFELEYSGTTIVYKINGAQLYTSTVSAGMTLYFSAFIEDVGIYITGIQIGTYASDGTPGNISGQITSSNVSTYIASAAIGSAYISNLNADKITSGTLQASTSITVGTSTDGLILDGSAKNIIAKSSNVNRVKFGNLGSTYGIQGWKTGVTNPIFQLDETGLDAYIKETVLKKFGASYKMPIVIAGDYTFASNALTTNIEIPITTDGTYRLVFHATGYWESDSLTRSAACMRYGTNGVYFNNDVFAVRDMQTIWLTSDSADSSGTVGPFGASCIDVVWNATTFKLELQLKAFTNASPTGMSYFTYIIWAVDNAAYPFTTY